MTFDGGRGDFKQLCSGFEPGISLSFSDVTGLVNVI